MLWYQYVGIAAFAVPALLGVLWLVRRRPIPDPAELGAAVRRRKRGITPAQLHEQIKQYIKCREPALVIGPPGVGKTTTTKIAARECEADGVLKKDGFVVITGCKDLTQDALFETTLYIDENAKNYVNMLPSLVRKHVGKWMIPITECSPEDAVKRWPDDAWYLIIFDEATRATPAFIDALLPVCNDFQVTVEGKAYYAPVLVLSLGNPAGMDASTVAFSHAFTSRQYGRITMYQPGPEEIAEIYSLPHVRRDADRWKIPAASRPNERDALLACAVLTLMWGLPLDRKGMASLSEDALALIAEMEKRDPALAAHLHKLGELLHFSCDPRKGRRWLTTAMRRAAAEGMPFDVEHLAATAVQCLSVGIKTTFSEGQEPHLQLRLEELIDDIAQHALHSRALRDLLAERARQRARASSPDRFAEVVAARLFENGKSRSDLVARLLTDHDRQLRADAVPDREVRGHVLTTFLQRAVQIRADLPTADLHASVRNLATRADAAVLVNGDFFTHADRKFFQDLARADRLGAIGKALAALTHRDGSADRLAPLLVEEEVRLAGNVYPSVQPYESELINSVQQHSHWRNHVENAAAILDIALRRCDASVDADIEPVITRLFELFPLPPQGPDARPFFKCLFRQVQEQVQHKFHACFERLLEKLETMP